MSMISGSGGGSGMGASSSSSDDSAMAQPTGSSGAGSGSICLANNASVACSSLASSTVSRNSASVLARKTLFSSQRSVSAREVHSAYDWRKTGSFDVGELIVMCEKRSERAHGARITLETKTHSEQETGTQTFVALRPSECEELSRKGSKEYFVETTGKIRGTVHDWIQSQESTFEMDFSR